MKLLLEKGAEPEVFGMMAAENAVKS